MTTRDDLLALAARVETTTEPTRELADEVLLACGWRLNHDPEDVAAWRVDPGTCEDEDGSEHPVTLGDRMNWACWYKPGNRPFRDAWIDGHYRPDPLASLDAAMTLISAEASAAGEVWRAEGYSDSGVLAPHVRASAWVAGAPRVYAATPALALTAAALRSRAGAAA